MWCCATFKEKLKRYVTIHTAYLDLFHATFNGYCICQNEKVNSKFLILFIVYFLADCYIQHFSRQYISLDSIGLKFSWVGKILSLLLALTIIFSVSKTHREQIGFTSKVMQRNRSDSESSYSLDSYLLI